MIRVGIPLAFPGDSWLGGLHYYRNLVAAVASIPECMVESVILMPTHMPQNIHSQFETASVVETRSLDRGSLPWIHRQVTRTLIGRDSLLERELSTLGVDVFFHTGHLGSRSPFPMVGWIPDFQHMHFPQLFSARDIRRRNSQYREMCNVCKRIVVSSVSAQRDLEQFNRCGFEKSVVLKFATHPPAKEASAQVRRSVINRYALPERFFLLPNQFWSHKNHRVVVDAVGLLAKNGVHVNVVTTGNMKDSRHIAIVTDLTERIRLLGISYNFRMLGVVPYDDLLVLFEQSVAIINPSLFEGWSTTVEEAKSLAKRVLLSDIPVHREQAPNRAKYFPPHASDVLADLMDEAWKVEDPPPSSARQVFLNEASLRWTKFGRDFQELMNEAANGS
jgi:glycosyltransferase involved in cell wall biosynthesis